MELAVILALAAAITIYELPPLIKNCWWREAGAFLALLSVGVFLALAQALDWDIPNPVDAVEYIFTPVSIWVDKILS